MNGSIFISYRRDDAAGYAGRLYDRLAGHFGADRVFMDVEGIEPGTDFVDAIERAVGSCEILIVIIGREWLAKTTDGKRRLDDPADFVRLETAAALKRGIRVVPVLIEGAPMPNAHDLPADVVALARRQAVELNHRQWDATTAELIATLERILQRSGNAVVAEASGSARPTRTINWRHVAAALAVLFALGAAAFFGLRGGENDKTAGTVARVKPDVVPAPEVPKAPTKASAEPEKQSPPSTLATTAETSNKTPTKATEASPANDRAVVHDRVVANAPTSKAASPPVESTQRVPKDQPVIKKVPPGREAQIPKAPEGIPADHVAPKTQPAKAPAAPADIATEPPAREQIAKAAPTLQPPTSTLPARLPRVGDAWFYRSTSIWRNVEPRTYAHQVTAVSERDIRETLTLGSGREQGGESKAFTPDVRYVEWRGNGYYLVEFNPFLAAFDALRSDSGWKSLETPVYDPMFGNWYTHGGAKGWESVTVSAGTFNALRVQLDSSRQATASIAMRAQEPVRVVHVAWYAPEVKRMVKQVRTTYSASGTKLDEDTYELVRYTLH